MSETKDARGSQAPAGGQGSEAPAGMQRSQAPAAKRQQSIQQYFGSRSVGLMQLFRSLADIEPHILQHIISILPKQTRAALRQASRFMRTQVNLATSSLKLDDAYLQHKRDLSVTHPFVQTLTLDMGTSDLPRMLQAVQQHCPRLLRKLQHLHLRFAYSQLGSSSALLPTIVAACDELSAMQLTIHADPGNSRSSPLVSLSWKSPTRIKPPFSFLLADPLLLTDLLDCPTSARHLTSLVVQGQPFAVSNWYSDQHHINPATALPTFSTLTNLVYLNLHGLDLTEPSRPAPPTGAPPPAFRIDSLPQLTSLILQGCWPRSGPRAADALLQRIGNLTGLRCLSLGDDPFPSNWFMHSLLPEATSLPPGFAKLTALTYLRVHATCLAPDTFTLLHPLTSLQHLSVKGICETINVTPFLRLTCLHLRAATSYYLDATIPVNLPLLQSLELQYFNPKFCQFPPPPHLPPGTPPDPPTLTALKLEGLHHPIHMLPPLRHYKIITYHPTLLSISVSRFSLSCKFFRAVAALPALSELVLMRVRLKGSSSALPVAALPHLTRLVLNVSTTSPGIRECDREREPTDALLSRLHLPSLKVLSVSSCCSLLPFFMLLHQSPALRASARRGDAWAAHVWFDNAQLLAVACLNPTLLPYLIVEETRTCMPNLTDAGVTAAAAAAGPALLCLRLHLCSTKAPLTDASLQALAQDCSRLQCLHLCSSVGFTGRAVQLASRLPELQDLRLLDVAGLGDKELAMLGHRCGKLTELVLGSMAGVGRAGYLALGGLVRLQFLETNQVGGLRVAYVQELLPMLPSLSTWLLADTQDEEELENADWEAIVEEAGCAGVDISVQF